MKLIYLCSLSALCIGATAHAQDLSAYSSLDAFPVTALVVSSDKDIYDFQASTAEKQYNTQKEDIIHYVLDIGIKKFGGCTLNGFRKSLRCATQF